MCSLKYIYVKKMYFIVYKPSMGAVSAVTNSACPG